MRQEVSRLNQLVSSLQESLIQLQQQVRNDLETIKTSNQYHYAEFGRDIEELRDEFVHQREIDNLKKKD